MKGRVYFSGTTCIAEVVHEDVVIWSDNSGRGAWPMLVGDAHEVAKAGQIMHAKGQRFDSWSDIVDRASKL